jgi:hypothetical protein
VCLEGISFCLFVAHLQMRRMLCTMFQPLYRQAINSYKAFPKMPLDFLKPQIFARRRRSKKVASGKRSAASGDEA